MKIINIDRNSSVPKYKQIIASIEAAITDRRVAKGDKLASVNKVALEFSISRDTVLLAYDELKKRGVIHAILGKGYYIKSVEFSFEQRIFLLFDELNSFKEDIFNSFLERMGNSAQIDIFFHHFNINMFTKLVNEGNGEYSKYIIMPTNVVGAADVIKTLPKNDVYILDQTNVELVDYPSIHQNFVKNMYESLLKGKERIFKYENLILIFPGLKEPLGMVEGFEKFCSEFQMSFEVISSFEDKEIQQGDVYVIPSDRDLVKVIEQAKLQQLVLGNHYGIISYNDTPLKKVVENGITTISTDFKAMGRILADMILNHTKTQIENECYLIERNSL